MTESAETAIAVLKVQVASIITDADKREKLHDARHAETMLKLEQLSIALTSGQSFNRGVKAAVAAGWAIAGGFVAMGFQWLISRGPQ